MNVSNLKVFESLKVKMPASKNWEEVDIIKVEGKTVFLGLPKTIENISVSQIVNCCLEEGKNKYLFNGEIYDIIFSNPQAIVIYVPGNLKKFIEFRKEPRFEETYLGQVSKLRNMYVSITDISVSGLRIHSDSNLEVGDRIGIMIFHTSKADEYIACRGMVAWKKDHQFSNLYGIEIEEILDEYKDVFFGLMEELNNKEVDG